MDADTSPRKLPSAQAPTEPQQQAEADSASDRSGVAHRSPLVCQPGRRYGEGTFLIKRLVGEGGMSQIYHAFNEITHQDVAFKVLLPRYRRNEDIIRRMRNEARALAEVDHASIVKFYQAGHDPEVGLYIVLELLCGRDLRQILNSMGKLPLSDALMITITVADAIHQLHRAGIFHRDLKPENIFITDGSQGGGQQVKCLDLGTVKASKYKARTTELNMVVGTSRYMSPEHVLQGRITQASDQYSLALIVYELLCGHHAFGQHCPGIPSSIDFCVWQVNAEPEPLEPSVCPPALWGTLERALAKNPEERFESIKAFADALATVLASHGSSAGEVAASAAVEEPARGDAGGSTQSMEVLRELLAAAAKSEVIRTPSGTELMSREPLWDSAVPELVSASRADAAPAEDAGRAEVASEADSSARSPAAVRAGGTGC